MKKFVIIFLVGMAAFVALDFVSTIVRSDSFDDAGRVERVGVPLVYETGPDYQDRSFRLGALLTDIGFAVVVSGMAAKFFSSHRHNRWQASLPLADC
jgi:hypothetical protein